MRSERNLQSKLKDLGLTMNDGIWTFWQGLILVISSLKWSPFLIMIDLNSWGILAALQNITKALEGCDIKSAKILSVILLKVKFFWLFVVDIQSKTNKTQRSKLKSPNLSLENSFPNSEDIWENNSSISSESKIWPKTGCVLAQNKTENFQKSYF